jgi:hypothetical protein
MSTLVIVERSTPKGCQAASGRGESDHAIAALGAALAIGAADVANAVNHDPGRAAVADLRWGW